MASLWIVHREPALRGALARLAAAPADALVGAPDEAVFDTARAPDAVLNKPISVLDLSVRARKAIQFLNIQTVGDLATRTEAELMGVKNFGATSLIEIQGKLAEFGLSLRTLE